ncbi:unnamed protein product [Vitrella brassicaformis CCMP3155]|uniref:Uncharacterized protein n=1 Tax=Vitrella brassicaformis (strain CCMP3155) TaxID=1169540 RepID=A0A0G4H6Y2_VITBC|nr:unnamed protein product [Vitrella brassicaformis CCMP3155]|eukprot:CEM39621.1 unnamed protein product [Vitrella brassicaformis CCMP3155]
MNVSLRRPELMEKGTTQAILRPYVIANYAGPGVEGKTISKAMQREFQVSEDARGNVRVLITNSAREEVRPVATVQLWLARHGWLILHPDKGEGGDDTDEDMSPPEGEKGDDDEVMETSEPLKEYIREVRMGNYGYYLEDIEVIDLESL